MPTQRSVSEQIVRAIAGFPKYALEYLLGFYIILTDIEMTTLAILGGLTGYLIAPLWGLVIALTLWLILRTAHGVAVGLARSLESVASAGHRLSTLAEYWVQNGPQASAGRDTDTEGS